jgi:hypothetical protein
MTSCAKEGPERKTAGCLRSRAEGTTSDIICPVATSRPLDTQTMGTSGASRVRTPCRKARLCCTGTACTAYCAPVIASAASVVARTLGGSVKLFRYLVFTWVVLMSRHR